MWTCFYLFVFFCRDGEEWFECRKILNQILLKNFHITPQVSDFFTKYFDTWNENLNNGEIMDLEKRLYNLSIICKWKCTKIWQRIHKNGKWLFYYFSFFRLQSWFYIWWVTVVLLKRRLSLLWLTNLRRWLVKYSSGVSSCPQYL